MIEKAHRRYRIRLVFLIARINFTVVIVVVDVKGTVGNVVDDTLRDVFDDDRGVRNNCLSVRCNFYHPFFNVVVIIITIIIRC